MLGKGANGMDDYDEQAGWSCLFFFFVFEYYVIYTQCKQQNAARQEDSHADRDRRPGDYGAAGG